MCSMLKLTRLTFVQHNAITYREEKARMSLRQKSIENVVNLIKRRLNIKVFHNLKIIF